MSEARIIDEIVTDVNQHTTAAIGGIKMSSNGRKLFATDGVFIVPEGVTEVWVTGCGAGGGGFRQDSGTYWLGGAGQACSKVRVSVVINENIKVTIGRAGGEQSVGGTTSFGNKLTLSGGKATLGTGGGGITQNAAAFEPLGEAVLTEFGVPTGGNGGYMNASHVGTPHFYAFTLPTITTTNVGYVVVYAPIVSYGKGGLGSTSSDKSIKTYNGVLLIEW